MRIFRTGDDDGICCCDRMAQVFYCCWRRFIKIKIEKWNVLNVVVDFYQHALLC